MRNCVNCNQAFTPKSKVHSICSDECRRALRGYEYRTNRAIALHRDGFKCTECGCTDALECHHIKMLSQGGDSSVSNLQTLCQPCHKAVHKAMRMEARIEDGRSEEYDYAA